MNILVNDLTLMAMYCYNLLRHSQKRTGHPFDFETLAEIMKKRSLEHNYSDSLVSMAHKIARDWQSCPNHQKNDKCENMFLKNWHILQSDTSLKDFVCNHPLICCRTSRNIGDRVVHSVLPNPTPVPSTWLLGLPNGVLPLHSLYTLFQLKWHKSVLSPTFGYRIQDFCLNVIHCSTTRCLHAKISMFTLVTGTLCSY